MRESNRLSKERKTFLNILIHCILPITFGISIYAFFRGINIIDPSKIILPLFQIRNSNFFLYSIPDGLWLYSFLSSLTFIWKNNTGFHFHFWVLTAIILSLLSEFFQFFQLITGTFDFWDLVAYGLATFAFFLNFKVSNYNLTLIQKKHSHEK